MLITCSLADATIDSINSSLMIADDDVMELLSWCGNDSVRDECLGFDIWHELEVVDVLCWREKRTADDGRLAVKRRRLRKRRRIPPLLLLDVALEFEGSKRKLTVGYRKSCIYFDLRFVW